MLLSLLIFIVRYQLNVSALSKNWKLVVFVLVLVLMPLIRIWGLFFMLGVVSIGTLGFSLLLLIVELCLKILRAIVWRIAEYKRGAFAAIILIVTIILGITDFYLKNSQK